MESKIAQPTFHARFTVNDVRIALANDANKKKEKGIQVIEKGIASNPPPAPNSEKEPEEPEVKEGKKPKKKSEPKKPEKPAKAKNADLTFPTTIRINAYGFIGINKPLLAALGWKKDMALVVVKNPDGSVTVKKAT